MRKLELRSCDSAFEFSVFDISDLTIWECCAAVEHLALLCLDQSRLARAREVLDAGIHEACIPGVGIFRNCVAIRLAWVDRHALCMKAVGGCPDIAGYFRRT